MIWEWCLDWWQRDLGTEPVTDPVGPDSGGTEPGRVLRGDFWNDYAKGARSAYRGALTPGITLPILGFRLAAPGQPANPPEGGG